MSRRPSLRIYLENVDRRRVAGARVELARAGETRGEPLRFDEVRQCYTGEAEPGEYALIVDAPGYRSAPVPLRVEPQGLSTSITLGREGEPYYVLGGRRVYYAPPPGDALATVVSDERGRRIAIVPRQAAALRRAEGDVGPIVRGENEGAQFLSRAIEVISRDGVTREELEEAVRPFGLRIVSQNGIDPRLYRVELEGIPDRDFGAMPERIAALPVVRSASSIVVAMPELAAAPADVLYPLQFPLVLMRVPEAWGKLGGHGSADVIVAVLDTGIATTTTPDGVSTAIHPAFAGTVTGGTLTATLGNNTKLVHALDFSLNSPFIGSPGNDEATDPHGSSIAGIISAAADADGVVGIAANTRLASYFHGGDSSDYNTNSIALICGLNPGWTHGDMVVGTGDVAFPIASGWQLAPGAAILNNSYTHPGSVKVLEEQTLQRATLFGRDRRGVVIFAAVGNEDKNARDNAQWAENTNLMRVAASTLDVREEEVRSNFSSWSDLADPILDFCAPSASSNVSPGEHEVPGVYGFASTAFNTITGDISGALAARVNLTNAPAAGSQQLKIAAPDFGGFSGGETVIVRDKNDPLHAEVQQLGQLDPPDTLNLVGTLGFAYGPGRGEVLRLVSANGYTRRFGGTSAATAEASGVAALMLSAKPSLTWLEVRDLLRETSVPIALRYRGSNYGNAATEDLRYGWLDPNGSLLVDVYGALQIDDPGPDRTIAASDGPLNRGTRIVKLSNTAGIQPRQALVIGAETKLNGAVLSAASVIAVQRSDSFTQGDTIFIGRDVRTTLVRDAAAGTSELFVQSVDGIRPLDQLDVGGESLPALTMSDTKSSALPQSAYYSNAYTIIATTPLANDHPRGTVVTLRAPSFEGPFTVQSTAPGTLTLNKNVVGPHPDQRLVWKQGTELRAVIRVLSGNRVEIDPLGNAHAFNSAGVEHVRVGRIAAYSRGLGRGRIDALEVVRAALAYTHDERDLMIRGYAGDDGKSKDASKEIESPDLWVRNDAQSPNGIGYDETPHQAPEITIDPAIHIGAGKNDLEVSGTCTSDTEVTIEIEIDATTDHFQWIRNGGAATTNVAITGAAQDLSDGVKVKFASTSGHAAGDRWIIRARKIENRHLHARVRNRGTLPFFTKSAETAPGSPNALDVAQCRILLCVSDGYPIRRFVSVADNPGPNDLDPVAVYSGAGDRSLFSLEITAEAPSGDTFLWYRDGQKKAPVTLTAATTEQTLDGFKIRFGSHTGHKIGDRWTLYARKTDAFLNVDHYWDALPLPPVPAPRELFDPATGRAGSRVLYAGSVNGLGANASEIHHVEWPEALRPPTNNPNAPRPLQPHPRRFFLLAETVPHDGALTGITPKTNNNLAFREIAFAKFRFAQNNGAAPLDGQLDVDANGIQTTKALRVEVRTTCGTFVAEKVCLRFTAKKSGMTETRVFAFSGGWSFDALAAWVTASAPKEARRPDGSQPAATGEQFDIAFDCSITVDRSFNEVAIAAEIVSDFRPHVVVSGTHTITVVTAAPLPLGTGAALAATLPKPRSFVFADTAQLTQTVQQAFGPVAGDATNRYRVTALLTAPADVKAYAVARSLIAIQRNPSNNDTVNVILRPLDQPIAGFTPIRYFVYRGIRLSDYLQSASGAGAKLIVDPPQFPFLVGVRKTFLAQNPNVTDMPSTVFGYDPDNQTGSDALDEIFFRTGSEIQLPVIQAGEELGSFRHGGDFGFEIAVEEGGWSPTLDYARASFHEVDVTSLSAGTFTRRLKQEDILNFLDPAAFYGLHLHSGGVVRAPGNVKWEGADIYTNVVEKFFTKNRLYLDVRSENGSSLNFHGNYDVSGNQIQAGAAPAALTPQSYATDGWPIVFVDQSTWPAGIADFNEVYLQFPRNDNVEPVLYVAHGKLLTVATDGSFIRGDQLMPPNPPWTYSIGFAVPNTGSNPLKVGVAWILRLFYGRLFDPAAQIPNTVLKTAKYTDNVFGPIDRAPKWAGQAAIKWTSTQDDRYVDGPGWRQMMQCGLAVDSGTQRVLLYASATARDVVVDPALPVEFAPLRGMPSGVSQKASFFDEPGLFGVFQLEFDQTHDGATTVRTLQLAQAPTRGYAPTSALLLGLTKPEFDSLVALDGGISKDYLRVLLLADETVINDPDRPAKRYNVGIQGLKTADGTYASVPSSVTVYTVDGLLFASKAFADAEPLPTEYARNYEEAIGARDWPQRDRKIASVDGSDIVIANVDWRQEVAPGTKLGIVKAGAVDATFDVTLVTMSGDDTVISLLPNPPAAAASARAYTLTRKVEDRMIDLDQAEEILGITTTRSLVDAFVSALAAIPNNASAKNQIAAKIDDQGAKILERARALAKSDRPRADVYERALYWARLRMTVALKSHPLCLASIAARNELALRLEKKSRGYDVTFGAINKKVLLLGFDPFDLHENVERSNPSGAVALALHDTAISVPGKNAIVSSVLLPVRYRDFDAGVIEQIVEPLITAQGGVSMILSLSESDAPVYDLERIAGRRRLGYYDNERMTRPPERIGSGATWKEFYESTLPANQLVTGASFLTPPDAAQKLFFNQAYASEQKSFGDASDPSASPGSNANQPAYALNTITGNAVSGSSGSYFANELFYRIARSREETPQSKKPPTGHLHIPTPTAAKVGISGIIAEVEDMIERWLAGTV